jgi:hypothetical protein
LAIKLKHHSIWVALLSPGRYARVLHATCASVIELQQIFGTVTTDDFCMAVKKTRSWFSMRKPLKKICAIYKRETIIIASIVRHYEVC